jgi:hypothetical protein
MRKTIFMYASIISGYIASLPIFGASFMEALKAIPLLDDAFSLAPIFEFEGHNSPKLSLSPISSIDFNVQSSDLYRRLTQIFLGEEFNDPAKMSFYTRREKIAEAEVLVYHKLIDVNSLTSTSERLPFKDKGCLHTGLTDCFSDSEQAFLSYLGHPTFKDAVNAPKHLEKGTFATPLSGITQVELRLLTTKDICEFCRATLSKSLESSILRMKLSKYLNSQGIIDVEELGSNVPITIWGYSRVAISNTRG